MLICRNVFLFFIFFYFFWLGKQSIPTYISQYSHFITHKTFLSWISHDCIWVLMEIPINSNCYWIAKQTKIFLDSMPIGGHYAGNLNKLFFSKMMQTCQIVLLRISDHSFGTFMKHHPEKSLVKPEHLTDLMQMVVIGMDFPMGVRSLLMAHNCRQAGYQGSWTSCLYHIVSYYILTTLIILGGIRFWVLTCKCSTL